MIDTDPNTEARIKEENRQRDFVSLLVVTCARLQMCYDEIPAQELAEAFGVLWDKGASLINPVEFYAEVKDATDALKQQRPR